MEVEGRVRELTGVPKSSRVYSVEVNAGVYPRITRRRGRCEEMGMGPNGQPFNLNPRIITIPGPTN